MDAVIIASYLRTFGDDSTALPDDALISLKQLTRFRSSLLMNISAVKSQVIAILDKVFPEFSSLFSDTFGQAAKQLLLSAPTPNEILSLTADESFNLVNKPSKGRFKQDFVLKLQDAANNSFGIKLTAAACSFELKQLTKQIVFLEEQIEQLDIEIHKIYESLNVHLTSIPGIGTTALYVWIFAKRNFLTWKME